MLLPGLAIIAGFAFLIWGADRFIHGAAGLARNLGVPPMIIGLTVISFCTSAPEMMVSAIAALDGNRDMGIGNALGSNIANIGLVLGVTAMVMPLAVRSMTLKREMPMLLLITLLALALMSDGELGRADGCMLLLGLMLLLWWLTRIGLAERSDPLVAEVTEAMAGELEAGISLGASLLWLLLGISIMLASSKAVVWGAVAVAQWLGVSDLVIGLTVIAIGTSLPELVASIVGVLKGEADLALGNVIGSNMFNIMAVLGMPALISPGAFAAPALLRDFPVMLGLTLAMLVFAFAVRDSGRISRLKGLLLFAAYAGYLYLLYLEA